MEATVATTEDMHRRLKRVLYWTFPITVAMLVSSFLGILGIDSEPWRWTRTILFAIAAVVMIVLITRFSLWQRDEYWRERGRDPKHPERFPSDGA
jgi:MFS family permease